MFLRPVEHLHQNEAVIGAPRDTGQILVMAEIIAAEIHCRAGSEVIHSETDIFRGHTCHGIPYFEERAGACVDIQKRECPYGTFVFPVESHLLPRAGEEYSFSDTELVPAYILAVTDCRIR